MRRLAFMGALSFLALLGAFSPLPALADIEQSVVDASTTDAYTSSGGWTQFLGTGISGTSTEVSFNIDWQPLAYYLGDRMGLGFIVCSDPAYTICGSTYDTNFTFYSQPGPTVIKFNSQTLDSNFGISFDPKKYYQMSVYRILPPFYNFDRAFKVLGSVNDTYPEGNTTASGLADLGFKIVGASRVATSTATSTPTDSPSGIVYSHLEGGSILTPSNYSPGGIPAGIGIPYTQLANVSGGDYYVVVFFEGLVGCPSNNYEINTFQPGAYWGLDVLPNSFSKAESTSGGGCMQQFHVRPADQRSTEWFFGALSNTGTANAIADAAGIQAFAVCTDAASCNSLVPSIVTSTTSNVLFLPGIEGSRLYEINGGTESKLWEPSILTPYSDLALDETGKSVRSDIYTRDVLEKPYGTDIYASFIANLETEKQQHKINDFEVMPYDWRLSLNDLLTYGRKTGENISYSQATDTPYILQEVRKLAAESPSHKITIIAHSNGGLVAKEIIRVLGAEAPNLINKVILVASPQAGTPQAVAGLLHGEDAGLPSFFPIIFPANVARRIGNNSPTLYNLLPSEKYFTYVDTPIITIDPATMPDWVAKYGETIHSRESLRNFLLDTYQRTSVDGQDLETPVTLNSSILDTADTVHSNLDAWEPPPGINLIQIAGWGIPKTIGSLKYSRRAGVIHVEPQFVVDGDGTVVAPSALWTSNTSENVKDYWFNLALYNADHENAFQQLSTFWDVNHANILSIPEIGSLLTELLTGSSTVSLNSYVSTQSPNTGIKHLQYALHSPLTLDLYDDQGRHTGISSTTGQLEENIPGTYYLAFGDVKYIFADEISGQHIHLNGYDTGTFTLNIDEYEGSTLLASTTFKDIPTTNQTKARLDVSTDIQTLSQLSIDKNGDGITDLVLTPKINDTVTIPTDVTAPVTTLVPAGEIGNNSWFKSDVLVTLTARDTESGVASTTYSLNGDSWLSYTAPFSLFQEGTSTIRYYSIDKAGNKEATNTVQILIDKRAPEALIKLDVAKRSMVIGSIDTLTGTSTMQLISSGTLSSMLGDFAGHSLKLTYLKNEQGTDRAVLNISTLTYDGVTTQNPAVMRFYWFTSSKTINPSILIGFIKTKEAAVIALYTASSNKTIIVSTTPSDEMADLSTLATSLILKPRPIIKQYAGLVIPHVLTDRGKVILTY